MHILFLTDNFPPEVNAPASRTFEHARAWVRAGHQVTVITGAPNFPGGKLLGGYRNKLWQAEQMEGIRVVRVWTYITANEGFAKRILDYLSFMLSGFIAGLFVRRADLVVGTSPQFFTACAAWALAGLKRRPFVFELRDLWPESIKAVGAMKESAAIRWLERLELFLYRRASLIVAVTHSFKRRLIERGVDGTKIEVITNGADLSRFRPQPKDQALLAQHGLQGCFVAGYVGTHGLAHQLETLLEAAALLAQRPDGDRYRILLLGDGARKAALREMAAQRGLTNVVFVDSVSKDQVVRYWSILDASVIHLKQTPLFDTVIPSKLFECMAMGLPVLHGVAGESADIVRETGAGLPFTPEDAQALADAIVRLAGDAALVERLRAQAQKAASLYERDYLAERMLEHLLRLNPNTESKR